MITTKTHRRAQRSLALLLPLAFSAVSARAQQLSVVQTLTSPTVNSFDNCQGWAVNVDADPDVEWIAYNDQFLQVVDNNGLSNLALINEPRWATLWRAERPHVVRVGAGRFVVIKRTSGNQIGVVSLYNDPVNGYVQGSYILAMTQPMLSSWGKGWLGTGAVEPGRAGTLVHVGGENYVIGRYTLAVSASGAISLTQSASNSSPPAPNPANRGNGLSRYELITDTGVDHYLFGSDIIRESDMSTVASWVGLTDPQLTFPFSYTTYGHVDSTVIINSGTATAPQYRVFAMTESSRVVGADMTFNNGVPVLDVLFTSVATGGQRLAVGNVAGFAGPVVTAGSYVMDFNGATLAATDDGSDQDYVWTHDMAGLEGTPFQRYFAYRRMGATMGRTLSSVGGFPTRLYQYPTTVSGPAHSYAGNWPRWTGLGLVEDAAGDAVQRLVAFNNQNSMTMLAHPLETSRVVSSQREWDVLRANTMSQNIIRGSDNLRVEVELLGGVPTAAVTPVTGTTVLPTQLLSYTLDHTVVPQLPTTLSLDAFDGVTGAPLGNIYPTLYLAAPSLFVMAANPVRGLDVTVNIPIRDAINAFGVTSVRFDLTMSDGTTSLTRSATYF